MSTRIRIAFWCYLLGTLMVTAFGIVYLVRPEFMAYHAVAVGMPWVAVAPSFQVLILALMRRSEPPAWLSRFSNGRCS